MSLYIVDASAGVVQLPSIPVSRHTDGPLIKAAFELAEKTGRTVYDSLYLALANKLGGQVVTADDRFVNALSATPWAKMIVALRQVP